MGKGTNSLFGYKETPPFKLFYNWYSPSGDTLIFENFQIHSLWKSHF